MYERSNLPRAFRGFEHINRYWDPHRQMSCAKILPGELYVTGMDENILTTLGSCVAACVWDPVAKVGGANHFMLPGGGDPSDIDFSKPNDATRYGSYAMEHLINGLLQNGAKRDRLHIKIAGGGRVLKNTADVGARNIAFALEYIRTERLKMMGQHVGGDWPVKICFNPLSGNAQIKVLRSMANDTIVTRERDYLDTLKGEPRARPVTMFNEGAAS